MFIYTFKFTRKTASFIIIMAALILIGIVLLAGAHNTKTKLETQVPAKTKVLYVKDSQSGAQYLSQYGWEVETPAQSVEEIVIPRVFSEVFENYNELQLEQGYDLSEYCGLEVLLYTYKVLNHESGDNVMAQLYVCNNSVIGGDIHSTALDGFMTGIREQKSTYNAQVIQ